MDYREAVRLFKYNPSSGELIWLVNKGRARIGQLVRNPGKSGYWRVTNNGKMYLAHRLAWLLHYGKWPVSDLDHINKDKTDNRIINLRLANKEINGKNLPLKITNTSGCCGVTWDNKIKKWQAQIVSQKKYYYLGSHGDWFDAVCARKAAEHQYNFSIKHGQRTNNE